MPKLRALKPQHETRTRILDAAEALDEAPGAGRRRGGHCPDRPDGPQVERRLIGGEPRAERARDRPGLGDVVCAEEAVNRFVPLGDPRRIQAGLRYQF